MSLDVFDARDGALPFCSHGALVMCACTCITRMGRKNGAVRHDTMERLGKTHGLFKMDSEPVKKSAS